MPIFEIQGNDGSIYEVEAPSMEEASKGFASFQGQTESIPESPEAIDYDTPEAAQLKLAHQERAQGQGGYTLPAPTGDMYKNLSWDDQHRMADMYAREEGYEPAGMLNSALGVRGHIGGNVVPQPYLPPLNNQVGRVLSNVPQAALQGVNNLLETVEAADHKIADITGIESLRPTVDYQLGSGSELIPGDSLVEEIGHEASGMLVPGLGAAKAMGVATTTAGKLLQFVLIDGFVGSATSSKEAAESSWAKDLLGIDNIPEDDEEARLLVGKAGLAVDYMVLSGLIAGAGKAAGKVGKIAKEQAVDPLLRHFNLRSAADKHTIQTFAKDFIKYVDGDDLTQAKVIKALSEAMTGEGDTFSQVYKNLDTLKQDPRYADVADQITRVQEHTMNMKNAVDAQAGTFEKYSHADTMRRASGIDAVESVADDIAPNPEFAKGTGTHLIRETGEKLLQEADTLADEAARAPKEFADRVLNLNDKVRSEVTSKYSKVKEIAGDYGISPDMVTKANEAGLKWTDDMSYGEALDSLKEINKRTSAALQGGRFDEVRALGELRDHIYDGEVDSLAGVAGLKDAAEEARSFYKNKYAKWFKNKSSAPSRAAARVDELSIPESERIGGATDVASSAAIEDTIKRDISPDAPKSVVKGTKDMIQDIGDEGDLASMERAMSLPKQAKEFTEEAEKFTRDTLGDFSNRESVRRPGTSGKKLPKGVGSNQRQYSNMFKEGPDRASAILEEAKHQLSPKQFKDAKKGMQRAYLDHVVNSIAEDPKGLLTAAGTKKTQGTGALKTFQKSPEWEVASQLFTTKGEKKAFESIVDVIESVDLVDRAAEGAAKRAVPDVLEVITNSNMSKSDKAKNLLVTATMGVLNPAATKARAIGGMVLRSTDPRSEQGRLLDFLMANPEELAPVLNRMAKDLESNNLRKVLKTLRPYIRRGLVKSSYEDNEPDLSYLDRLETQLEQYEMEQQSKNTTVIEKTVK